MDKPRRPSVSQIPFPALCLINKSRLKFSIGYMFICDRMYDYLTLNVIITGIRLGDSLLLNLKQPLSVDDEKNPVSDSRSLRS